jgi:uncharacterized HAD superfamily protein
LDPEGPGMMTVVEESYITIEDEKYDRLVIVELRDKVEGVRTNNRAMIMSSSH